MKRILFCSYLFFCLLGVFAQDVKVSIVLNGIEINKGAAYIAVFNSADSYKKMKPLKSEKLESKTDPLVYIMELPEGEYLFSVYQDTNGSGKIDSNILGMPKEPVGLSNYEGKGIPGGFEKLKMKINADNTLVIVKMVRL